MIGSVILFVSYIATTRDPISRGTTWKEIGQS